MRGLVALFAVLAIATPALAGQTVTLRADTASAEESVTLGDLFDGAGSAAHVIVATRTGSSVVLDANVIKRMAQRAGLDWDNPEGLHKIIVHDRTALKPASHANTEVLAYTRSLNAGEIVQANDIAWIKAAGAPSDAPSDADMVIGQAAKRPVRSGAVVQFHDLGTALVMKPGDLVTVTYEADGVSLSLQGKAMAAAGVGDAAPVQNTQSKRIIQTLVTGPGQAVVGPTADQMKSARALRYAAR